MAKLTSIIYILEQSNRRPLKVFKSEDLALKTINSKPSYYIPDAMKPIQGGRLYKVQNGCSWVLVHDIDGQYYPDF